MKKILSSLAFTLIELLVVISIIAILASLAIPAVTSALVKGQMTQALNNEKQVHLATFNMSTDRVSTGDSTIGWPGDLMAASGTVAGVTTVGGFVKILTDNNYLKPGDLKVFAAAGVIPYSGNSLSITPFKSAASGETNCAYTIYAVGEADGASAIFLATTNATIKVDSATEGTCHFELDSTSKVFGDKGYVIFHRGGDGAILGKNQASKIALQGSLPILTGSSPSAGSGWLNYGNSQ
ncbi:MAG: prepilin-type N-terminal cleavage/methylation domain-containing protein [Verrucomicrobiota bacterium]